MYFVLLRISVITSDAEAVYFAVQIISSNPAHQIQEIVIDHGIDDEIDGCADVYIDDVTDDPDCGFDDENDDSRISGYWVSRVLRSVSCRPSAEPPVVMGCFRRPRARTFTSKSTLGPQPSVQVNSYMALRAWSLRSVHRISIIPLRALIVLTLYCILMLICSGHYLSPPVGGGSVSNVGSSSMMGLQVGISGAGLNLRHGYSTSTLHLSSTVGETASNSNVFRFSLL